MSFKQNVTIRNCVFSYKCNMNFEELNSTDNKNIKFCTECQKEVYYCATDDELIDAIQRNKCIAIYNPYNNSESDFILGTVEK